MIEWGGLRKILGNTLSVHRTSSPLSLLAMVAFGLGIALVPETLLDVVIAGVVYRELVDAQPQADLLLVSRKAEGGGAARLNILVQRPA